MKFTNFKTIKLATAPTEGDNPPSGAIYQWETLDGSNNLVINYRLSDGTDKTLATGGGSSNSAPVAVTSGTRNVVAADNGKLFTNAGATSDIVLSLDSVANLGNTFEIGIVGEVLSGYGYAQLMLHCDGENDSTTITNSVGSATAAVAGNVKISTAQSVFGGASLHFPGASGDKIYFTNGPVLGSENFSISCRIYPVGNQATYTGLFEFRPDGNNLGTDKLLIFFSGNSTIGVYALNGSDGWSSLTNIAVNLNAWNHVAIYRVSGTLYIAINGTIAGSIACSNNFSSALDHIGCTWDGYAFNGYMDEIMIRTGYSEFPAINFSVPDSAYHSTAIVVTPNATDQLPGTAAAGNSIQSNAKGDYIKLRATDTGWVCTGFYPASTNWVDLLD